MTMTGIFSPEENERSKRGLVIQEDRSDFKMRTLTLAYCLSCNFMLCFTIHLYMESSKVALYLVIYPEITET